MDARSFDGLLLDIQDGRHDGSDLQRGRFDPRELRVATIRRGSARDVVRTGWAGVILISQRVVDVLTGEGLTGWQAVSLSDLPDIGRPYFLLVITGRGGPTYGSDGIRFTGLPELGQFIDPEQWDGSDIFLADNRRTIFVGEEAARRLAGHRLTNLELEPIAMERIPLRPPSRG
jgi:hypothetical protein